MGLVRLGDVVLGEGRVKVIVPITGSTARELVAQASALADHAPDIVEWRVDHFVDAPDVGAVLAAAEGVVAALEGRPLVFTFRTAAQGGERTIDPADYEALNTAVVQSGLVQAVDVEDSFDTAAGDAVLAVARAHGVVAVGSHHDFRATPPAEEIVARLVAMQERGFDAVKMAVMPRDAGDVLALLNATWTMADRHAATPVITMAMAGLGVVTRLAAQVVGSCATFASVGPPSAPGQVPLDDLRPILALLDANLP